jgi:putative transposase
MSQRHPIQAEEAMFITTNIRKRIPLFKNPQFAREAIETLYRVQELHPFFLYGFVIMPDHCHLLLHVPEGESISKIVGVFKKGVAFNIGRGPIWQPRFHIKIPGDLSSVLSYIHLNPLKAGLVESPEHYPWSSASGKWDVSEFDML